MKVIVERGTQIGEWKSIDTILVDPADLAPEEKIQLIKEMDIDLDFWARDWAIASEEPENLMPFTEYLKDRIV